MTAKRCKRNRYCQICFLKEKRRRTPLRKDNEEKQKGKDKKQVDYKLQPSNYQMCLSTQLKHAGSQRQEQNSMYGPLFYPIHYA